MIQQILEEDPLDKAEARNNAEFLSISPVIRDALEKRRAHEIKQGNHVSMSLLSPQMIGLRNSHLLDRDGAANRELMLSQRITDYNNKKSHLLPSFAA